MPAAFHAALASENFKTQLAIVYMRCFDLPSAYVWQPETTPKFERSAAELFDEDIVHPLRERILRETPVLAEELADTVGLDALFDLPDFIAGHPHIYKNLEWTRPYWLWRAFRAAYLNRMLFGTYDPRRDAITVSPLLFLPKPWMVLQQLGTGSYPELFSTLHHELLHRLQRVPGLVDFVQLQRSFKHLMGIYAACGTMIIVSIALGLHAPALATAAASMVLLILIVRTLYKLAVHPVNKQSIKFNARNYALLMETHAHFANHVMADPAGNSLEKVLGILQSPAYGFNSAEDCEKIQSAAGYILALRALGVRPRQIAELIPRCAWTGESFDLMHAELAAILQRHGISKSELALLGALYALELWEEQFRIRTLVQDQIKTAYESLSPEDVTRLEALIPRVRISGYTLLNRYWDQKLVVAAFGLAVYVVRTYAKARRKPLPPSQLNLP